MHRARIAPDRAARKHMSSERKACHSYGAFHCAGTVGIYSPRKDRPGPRTAKATLNPPTYGVPMAIDRPTCMPWPSPIFAQGRGDSCAVRKDLLEPRNDSVASPYTRVSMAASSLPFLLEMETPIIQLPMVFPWRSIDQHACHGRRRSSRRGVEILALCARIS